jgi:hypothetical protein
MSGILSSVHDCYIALTGAKFADQAKGQRVFESFGSLFLLYNTTSYQDTLLGYERIVSRVHVKEAGMHLLFVIFTIEREHQAALFLQSRGASNDYWKTFKARKPASFSILHHSNSSDYVVH